MGVKKKDSELAKRVAERLKVTRKEAGKVQEDVIYDLNINISRVESGQYCVSLPVLKRLCDYYGISLEEFFRGL